MIGTVTTKRISGPALLGFAEAFAVGDAPERGFYVRPDGSYLWLSPQRSRRSLIGTTRTKPKAVEAPAWLGLDALAGD